MGEVVEAPAQGDGADAHAGMTGIIEVPAAIFQPAAQDMAHQGGLLVLEEAVDVPG